MHRTRALGLDPVNAFIARWSVATGNERANYQLFLSELCRLLEGLQLDLASDDTRHKTYVFERRGEICSPDGSVNRDYIDLCYR